MTSTSSAPRATEQSRAPLEESTIRPTGVISPVVRRSTTSASVSVGTGTDVAGRVQRLAAERARGATGGDDGPAPTGEGTRRRWREHDAQGLHGRLLGLLGVLVVALDDDDLAGRVPRERQG